MASDDWDLNLYQACLGHDAGLIRISDPIGRLNHSLHLIEQARHSIDIISDQLNPTIFDDERFSSHCLKLIRTNRRAKIRILVKQSQALVGSNHRLVQLQQRLSSAMALQILFIDDSPQELIIADKSAYISGDMARGQQCIVDYYAPKWVESLKEQFELLWNRSELDPNFRRLSI